MPNFRHELYRLFYIFGTLPFLTPKTLPFVAAKIEEKMKKKKKKLKFWKEKQKLLDVWLMGIWLKWLFFFFSVSSQPVLWNKSHLVHFSDEKKTGSPPAIGKRKSFMENSGSSADAQPDMPPALPSQMPKNVPLISRKLLNSSRDSRLIYAPSPPIPCRPGGIPFESYMSYQVWYFFFF